MVRIHEARGHAAGWRPVCDFCKGRKRRCSGTSPCTACVKKRITCSLVDPQLAGRQVQERPTATQANAKIATTTDSSSGGSSGSDTPLKRSEKGVIYFPVLPTSIRNDTFELEFGDFDRLQLPRLLLQCTPEELMQPDKEQSGKRFLLFGTLAMSGTVQGSKHAMVEDWFCRARSLAGYHVGHSSMETAAAYAVLANAMVMRAHRLLYDKQIEPTQAEIYLVDAHGYFTKAVIAISDIERMIAADLELLQNNFKYYPVLNLSVRVTVNVYDAMMSCSERQENLLCVIQTIGNLLMVAQTDTSSFPQHGGNPTRGENGGGAGLNPVEGAEALRPYMFELVCLRLTAEVYCTAFELEMLLEKRHLCPFPRPINPDLPEFFDNYLGGVVDERTYERISTRIRHSVHLACHSLGLPLRLSVPQMLKEMIQKTGMVDPQLPLVVQWSYLSAKAGYLQTALDGIMVLLEVVPPTLKLLGETPPQAFCYIAGMIASMVYEFFPQLNETMVGILHTLLFQDSCYRIQTLEVYRRFTERISSLRNNKSHMDAQRTNVALSSYGDHPGPPAVPLSGPRQHGPAMPLGSKPTGLSSTCVAAVSGDAGNTFKGSHQTSLSLLHPNSQQPQPHQTHQPQQPHQTHQPQQPHQTQPQMQQQQVQQQSLDGSVSTETLSVLARTLGIPVIRSSTQHSPYSSVHHRPDLRGDVVSSGAVATGASTSNVQEQPYVQLQTHSSSHVHTVPTTCEFEANYAHLLGAQVPQGLGAMTFDSAGSTGSDRGSAGESVDAMRLGSSGVPMVSMGQSSVPIDGLQSAQMGVMGDLGGPGPAVSAGLPMASEMSAGMSFASGTGWHDQGEGGIASTVDYEAMNRNIVAMLSSSFMGPAPPPS
eukprot:GFYU01006795.1.p1 GENE.GFYU01006795.1~~GFYU01006795.1.p1  ORF type:complete len:877 (-),score=101.34 GFYU01006795.1:187-2817(-)